jgi:putative redox protein
MISQSFSKHSIVATPEGGMRFSISVRGHRLFTDQPASAGGTDEAPTPLELLGASLSGCVALYVHNYCVRTGLPVDDLAVEVRPVWRPDPGCVTRYDIIVHLPESIVAEHRAELERVARSCPVHHTLEIAPSITLELRGAALVAA